MAQDVVPWLIGANALLSMAALVYSWFSSNGAKTIKRVDELETIVEGMREEWDEKAEARGQAFRSEIHAVLTEVKQANALASSRTSMMEQHVAVLQSRLEQLPSSAVTQRLEVALARLEGRIDTLAERIQPVAAVAARLQEHAMEEQRR